MFWNCCNRTLKGVYTPFNQLHLWHWQPTELQSPHLFPVLFTHMTDHHSMSVILRWTPPYPSEYLNLKHCALSIYLWAKRTCMIVQSFPLHYPHARNECNDERVKFQPTIRRLSHYIIRYKLHFVQHA